MKKSIIAAGAASVALAAMPIVGVFATGGNFSGGPFVDQIQTEIADTCTFARGTIAGGGSAPTDKHPIGTWTTEAGEGANANKDILNAVSVTPAAAEATLGSSNYNVVCNDQDGYQVAVETTALTFTASGKTQVHPWAYTASATTPENPTASYWRLASNGENVDLGSGIVSKKTSAQDGKDFTITYYAWAQTGQDSGTYKATATYTATQL